MQLYLALSMTLYSNFDFSISILLDSADVKSFNMGNCFSIESFDCCLFTSLKAFVLNSLSSSNTT